ncbi:hypothetical protein PsYK624_050100 [Phanerochaete sordida]|uniref:Uncharacterized protein n=1 Tax=Phanerochaete sordida TaxID=48140 RepID=A0A9P3G6E6_9APHY|nr:hypothetical protein PsYK624_050100 [Phanerochaete sordida]
MWRQVVDPVAWTVYHRREAESLRKSVQDQLGLACVIMGLHNLLPSESSPTQKARVQADNLVVAMGRTPSGNPNSMHITFQVPISKLDLAQRRPKATPPLARRSVSHVPHTPVPPSISHIASLGRRAVPTKVCVAPTEMQSPPSFGGVTPPRTATPASSVDIAEWPPCSPVEVQMGHTHFPCAQSTIAGAGSTRPNRPSLPRLTQLRGRGSRSATPSPVAASPARRVG